MRNSNKELEDEGDKRLAIPITVRQLEAVVRISESLAKMELKPFATDAHVDEAIRIFQVRRGFNLPSLLYRLYVAGIHPLCCPVWGSLWS